MSDLKLIPPDQLTPFEQRLLDSVANESPSPEQRARVRLALGLPAVAPQTPASPPVARRALLLKAGGGLALSGALVALFLGGAQHRPAPPPAKSDPVVPADSVALPTPSLSPAPASSTAPLAREANEPSAPVKRTSKPAPADSAADLGEQLRLIDAARAAVAAGNASAAAAALSSYRTRFPRGPFGQEAAVLQIKTLDLQGNHALAAAEARNFLARYPNSPHASVVRRIAGL